MPGSAQAREAMAWFTSILVLFSSESRFYQNDRLGAILNIAARSCYIPHLTL
jgi:hypothetical protein